MWGVATASHQIEGGNHQQLVCVRTPVEESSSSAGRLATIGIEGAEDVEIDYEILGVSHYRFSIEWSRIVPQAKANGTRARCAMVLRFSR